MKRRCNKGEDFFEKRLKIASLSNFGPYSIHSTIASKSSPFPRTIQHWALLRSSDATTNTALRKKYCMFSEFILSHSNCWLPDALFIIYNYTFSDYQHINKMLMICVQIFPTKSKINFINFFNFDAVFVVLYNALYWLAEKKMNLSDSQTGTLRKNNRNVSFVISTFFGKNGKKMFCRTSLH